MSYSKMPMYIFVTLLSLVLTFACYEMLAKRKPDMAVKGDLKVVYNHYKEEDAGYQYRFFINASTQKGQIPLDGAKVYWLKDEEFKAKYPNIQKSDFKIELMSPTEKGRFYAHQLPTMEKNHKTYFFIEVTDSQNNVVVMPESFLTTKVPYHVSFKQDPNTFGLTVHILLMIVALFFLLHGFYYAFNYLWNKVDWSFNKAVSGIAWGLLCYGISAFPLGIWIEYEKYGTYWTGFPLGWDMTDSKTLFNFAYWFVVIILVKGSVFSNNPQKNLVSYKTFAWLTVLGGILTMVVRFAIGHGDI
ncbi:MAG: hypothetical protein WC980_01180 [Candidatus Brocadiia bacterium]